MKYAFISDADIFIDVPERSYKVLDDSDSNATSITASLEISEKNKGMVDQLLLRHLHTGLPML